MKALAQNGYTGFVVFDNFGNFLLSTNRWQDFIDLTCYLKRNAQGDNRIYYYDVCTFHADDHDLFEAFVNQQRLLALDKAEKREYLEIVKKLKA